MQPLQRLSELEEGFSRCECIANKRCRLRLRKTFQLGCQIVPVLAPLAPNGQNSELGGAEGREKFREQCDRALVVFPLLLTIRKEKMKHDDTPSSLTADSGGRAMEHLISDGTQLSERHVRRDASGDCV